MYLPEGPDGHLEVALVAAHTQVKCFIKDEPYENYSHAPAKPPRAICARDDLGKALCGPFFHPIDDAFFNSRYSVKHIPYVQRPSVLEERLGLDGRFLVIDYSSYESSQRRALRELGENFVYRSLGVTESN